ncbi:MAG: superoxide dismutase [Pirellulales bacterium]|nr:superoxide dismutase [Pirellulales bacterium]
MVYRLPRLPYAYDALEPHIDSRTMEIHHRRHHGAYVANLNKAIEGFDFGRPTIEELLASIHTLPDKIRLPVRNQGGGHANHSLFFSVMSPDGGGEPKHELAEAIESDLSGFDQFQQSMIKAAMARFGSGWAWLSVAPDRRLVVEHTANQDSPLMHGHMPILGLDLWEHAYYLKYQNRRLDFVNAFFHVINWDAVSDRYMKAVREIHAIHV